MSAPVLGPQLEREASDWLVRQLISYFPYPLVAGVLEKRSLPSLAEYWLHRYGEAATERELTAGSWLVAVSWLLEVEPPYPFLQRWYGALIAHVEREVPERTLPPAVAAALALVLGGDPIWPTSLRFLLLKAVMALDARMRLLSGHEVADLWPGRESCWVLRQADGRWRIVRVIRGEVGAEETVLDFSGFLQTLERLIRRLNRLSEERQGQGVLWWGLIDLAERLRQGSRRLPRQLLNQSALVVAGLARVIALAGGGAERGVRARLIECSDLAAGARLLLLTEAPAVAEGEVVAMRLEEPSPRFPVGWMVGVARWRLSKSLGVLVGVQLLAPLDRPVHVLTLSDAGQRRGEVQLGVRLARHLPHYPQPLIVVPKTVHLVGRWWVAEEEPSFTLQVARFQPGRTHVVTAGASVFDLWPKEG